MPPRLVSFLGLFVMIGLAWAMSSHKSRVSWRLVGGGLLLQFAFALLILKAPGGRWLFDQFGLLFNQVLSAISDGAGFLFYVYPDAGEEEGFPPRYVMMRSLAIKILPTIIVFSSMMSILYYVGVMQRLVGGLAWVMRRTLGTSGAETLSAAANVFVGQTEAPLVIRPYVARMTRSELMVVMVGGFATIAGGVLGLYVTMLGPEYAGHLLTASVISAPAALLIAKVMQPEVEQPLTADDAPIDSASPEAAEGDEDGDATPAGEADPTPPANVLEAAAEGAAAGMKLALNVLAMLITFVALVAMGNAVVGWVGGLFGFEGEAAWTLQKAFGYAFAPIALAMGIPWSESGVAGAMLGEKMVLNEFLAYFSLSQAAEAGKLSERSVTIMTYALCGFANFSSIGIQLGGIGGIAPSRRSDLAQLGFRAMLGGSLAAFMTACIAGVLL
ncbi:MAG: nucleoside transporter C-terminal domain-containing protein [Planctomycetota bacterium]